MLVHWLPLKKSKWRRSLTVSWTVLWHGARDKHCSQLQVIVHKVELCYVVSAGVPSRLQGVASILALEVTLEIQGHIAYCQHCVSWKLDLLMLQMMTEIMISVLFCFGLENEKMLDCISGRE